ncbi:hypothetical protein G9A89_002932 [Geosiphon pyriformis]|nr:hypothetical protein G9A89_002932 [Geosiphon pyriformis]
MSTKEQKGMIAMCIFSTISNFATTGMLLWIWRQTTSNKTVTRLVMNLLFSDWIQSIGFMMTYRWWAHGHLISDSYCETQGILINLGDIGSVVHSFEPEWYVRVCAALIWSISLAFGLIGLALQKNGVPFYGSATGSWCWISESYASYRILFHYAIIAFLAVFMIVLYSLMFIKVYRRQGVMRMDNTKKVLQRVRRKLIYYPGVYIIIVFPLALRDTIVSGCLLASAGTVNSIIYGFTRNIVSIKSVSEIVPRIRNRLNSSNTHEDSKAKTTVSIKNVSKIDARETKSNTQQSVSKNDAENSDKEMKCKHECVKIQIDSNVRLSVFKS